VQRLTNASHACPLEKLLAPHVKSLGVKQCSAFIHPGGLASPSLSAGAPFKKWARMFTLGKMKNGGSVFPVAEMARVEVYSFPCSADTSLPICLQPWRAISLSSVCTFVNTRFVLVPYVARPKPQTIKHFFRIIRNKH
jgi:hypothetical protein